MSGLQSMSDLAQLERRLTAHYGEATAALICTGNALRLLRDGWGRTLDV